MVPRGDAPHLGGPRREWSAPCSRSRSFVRDFAEDNPATVVTVLRFANVLGTDIVTPISTNLSRPLCPVDRRVRPAGAVRRGGRRRPVPRTRHPQPHPRHLQRGGRRASSRGARWRASAAPGCLPLRRWAPGVAAAPLVRLGLIEFPPELEALLRYGRGVDTSRIVQDRLRVPLHDGRRRRELHPGGSAAAQRRDDPPSYTYEQDVEQFFRHSPAVVLASEGSTTPQERS